jgi:hypothetical protein
MGYSLPEMTNPCDFFLDTIAMDQRTSKLKEESLKRIDTFYDSFKDESAKFVDSLPDQASKHVTSGKKEWHSLWWTEFGTLLNRSVKDTFRNKAILFASVAQTMIITVTIFQCAHHIAHYGICLFPSQ